MKRPDIVAMTVDELVDRFVAIALAEDKAFFDENKAKYRRLHDEMQAVRKELKSRPGDQRRALLPLFNHPHVAVRLKAAKATLAIAPKEARQVIETIAASHAFYYHGDAGMCLWALDEGIFVPD
jgi:hypothetical protein